MDYTNRKVDPRRRPHIYREDGRWKVAFRDRVGILSVLRTHTFGWAREIAETAWRRSYWQKARKSIWLR